MEEALPDEQVAAEYAAEAATRPAPAVLGASLNSLGSLIGPALLDPPFGGLELSCELLLSRCC